MLQDPVQPAAVKDGTWPDGALRLAPCRVLGRNASWLRFTKTESSEGSGYELEGKCCPSPFPPPALQQPPRKGQGRTFLMNDDFDNNDSSLRKGKAQSRSRPISLSKPSRNPSL